VFGLMVDGGYAQTLIAPDSALYGLPPIDKLSAAEAAIFHCTFGTAWRSLVRVGELKDGEKVVITGANGGVGAAAVQVARRRGAQVVAVVRREGHAQFLHDLGAHDVVVAPDGRFHRRPEAAGADIVLECVGPGTFRSSLGCLRLGGRLLVVGNVDGGRAEINLGAVVVRGLKVMGPGGATSADMRLLLSEHGWSPWSFPAQEILPLEEADAAQRRVRQGGLSGRLVLTP
jgi:NADPH:quinone reductase-like Zn-dependent oxidoreductase